MRALAVRCGRLPLMISVIFAATAAISQVSQANPELEVRALQSQWMDAMKRGDGAALDRIIADTFTFVHSTGGMENKRQYVDRAIAGAQLFQRTETEVKDEQLRVYGGQTAVWTSRVVMRNKADHTETSLQSTNVYVKSKDGWQWVSGQSTRLPNRPPAAPIDASVLKRYLGEYEVAPARKLTVSEESGALRAVVTGWRPAELVPKSETEFVWFNPEMNVYSELSFVSAATGEVTHAVFRREGVEVWKAKKQK